MLCLFQRLSGVALIKTIKNLVFLGCDGGDFIDIGGELSLTKALFTEAMLIVANLTHSTHFKAPFERASKALLKVWFTHWCAFG